MHIRPRHANNFVLALESIQCTYPAQGLQEYALSYCVRLRLAKVTDITNAH